MSAEWGVWVDAPYGFALRVTQPGQPGKLFKTNNTDLSKSYLRTLHRATARGERGTEQQARAAWKPAGAVPPAHSFRGLVAPRLTLGPAVRGCPRWKQLAAADQKLLLLHLAPLAPLLLLQSRPRFGRAEKSWPSLLKAAVTQGSHNVTDSSLPRPAVGAPAGFDGHQDLGLEVLFVGLFEE